MNRAADTLPAPAVLARAPLRPPRSALARSRAAQARSSLAACHLCAHHCGTDRLAGELGACRAGPTARIFSAQTEVSDELELIPVFAIALSGCDLRCDFCITGAQSWNAAAGQNRCPDDVARAAETALRAGAHSIMILGGEPTIHLPTALEIVAALPDHAVLVWKTNAHASSQARALLSGLFDVWVADYKFGNDDCALRLARTPDYTRIARENLCWASRETGTELIVRHLLMPGHLECCWVPAAGWLAAHLPQAKVNLRTGFWPAWAARRHPELRVPTRAAECQEARKIARDLGLNLIQ